MSLSSVVRSADHVIVSAVTSGRSGECDPVQVIVAGRSISEALRLIRHAGFRHVKRVSPRGLSVASSDVEVAVCSAGTVFERNWHERNAWRPATAHQE
jgi:hypothetical protein